MFNITHLYGNGEVNPPIEALPALYDELILATAEHGDVAVTHSESGWCVSAHRDGRVVFEDLKKRGDQRHMKSVAREKVLELWRHLTRGEIESILAEPWKEGYGS